MEVSTHLTINGTAEQIWSVITDIDHSEQNIRGIDKIEILDRPEKGFVGLKWRETRTMYGKEATEVMWITDEVPKVSYRTRAESHGAVYISSFSIEAQGNGQRLTMGFHGEAQTLMAKVMNVIFSGMMKKSLVKTMQEDLKDIKAVVEAM